MGMVLRGAQKGIIQSLYATQHICDLGIYQNDKI